MKSYEAWILKAKNDLRSSRKLIKGEDSLPDTAIYHAHQCAEKALKGYLAYKKQSLQKTHDVELLVELCMEIDTEFKVLLENAKTLNPYSTSFRYPDIVLDPDMVDVLDAIEKAERILDFVSDKIS